MKTKVLLAMLVVALILGLAGTTKAVANDEKTPFTSTCISYDDDGNVAPNGTVECQYRVYLNLLGVLVTPNQMYNDFSYPCVGIDCPPSPPAGK